MGHTLPLHAYEWDTHFHFMRAHSIKPEDKACVPQSCRAIADRLALPVLQTDTSYVLEHSTDSK